MATMNTLRSSFKPLGKGILCAAPSSSDPTSVGPNVILLCGWMGAKLPHLFKYTKVYEERYPEAEILLVRSEPMFFLRPERTNQSHLLPLAERLKQLGCISYPEPHQGSESNSNDSGPIQRPSQPRILVHVFSNGGTAQVATLGRLLNKLGATSPSNLISALVIDSSPGSNGLSSTLLAFGGLVKNPFLRFFLKSFITSLYFCLYILGVVFRRSFPLDVLRRALLSPSLLPWMTKDTPRLYVYSRTDELIPADQVEAQARQSTDAGLRTQTEVFDESPHVAHARTDPKRYWGAVRRAWEAAASREGA
ncbi:hypothetical protein HGRIS_000968 [Hohenbuehelia grisea]|uniref:Uncharacterized protein n=1 Tax=Hohenbuehelia grisea TaxID=104357 RepID=A0ABR3IQA6_9AGAR